MHSGTAFRSSYYILHGISVVCVINWNIRLIKRIARDAIIRRELSKIAGKQVSLFQNIGVAELEKTLVRSIKPIMDKAVFTKDTSLQDPTNQEDYKQMVREVLTELKASKKIS